MKKPKITKIQVKHYIVSAPTIHPAHNDVRVLHLTDLHIRPNYNIDYIIDVANQYRPHFIAITGDYVCYDTNSLHLVIDFLNKLKFKKYATLGNHDQWTDPPKIIEALREGGCHPLCNESTILEINDIPFNIIGIDDKVTKNDKPNEACKNIDIIGSKLILSHVAESLLELDVIDNVLTLSGHTHGGQILLPGITNAMLHCRGLKFLRGFHRINNNLAYISLGVGESVPVRFRSKPEITIFDLKHGAVLDYSIVKC